MKINKNQWKSIHLVGPEFSLMIGKYIKKINQLKKYDEAYFDKDSPIISDKDYDNIKQEILDLEIEYKYLKHKNSPSNKIPAIVDNENNKHLFFI